MLAGAAFTLAAGPTIRLQQGALAPQGEWQERWVQRVPVSGSVVPGVLLGDPAERVMPEAISVPLPAGHEPVLCVTVTSKDGRYHAQATFRVPRTATGATTLQGPREFRSRLRRYPAGHLAIKAEFAARCNDRTTAQVPARWGAVFQQTDVFLLVNSRYYTEVLWTGEDGRSRTVVCPEVDADHAVAYNRECRLPRAELPDSVSLLVRSRREGSYQNTTLTLRYPR
jgi:hypothetical protein